MRLAVLTTSYPRHPGDDAGIFVQRLVRALGALGTTGIVVVPHDRAEPAEEPDGAFAVRRFSYGLLGPGTLAFGSGIVPKLRRRPWLLFDALHLVYRMAASAYAARETVDLVHANWIGAGVAAWLFHRRTGTPYVVTLRGEDARLLERPLLRQLLLPTLRGAAAVTGVNEAFLSLLRDTCGLPAARSHFIANGTELQRPDAATLSAFMQKGGWRTDRRYLLFVGTVTPRKRVDLLLKALPGLVNRGYELIICGRDEDPDYHDQLAASVSAELSPRVHFMGAVPPAEIPLYLTLAAGYVSASEFEGRPNAVLEALSLGVPAYLSDIPAHREVIRRGETGALFTSAEDLVELFAHPLKPFAAPPARTWEAAASEYLRCFEQACAQREASRIQP